MITKSMIRKEMIARRSGLDETARERYSGCICNRILSSCAYKTAGTVFAYAPFGSEADVMPIVLQALKDHKTVAFPRCEEKGVMRFYAIASEDDLVQGRYGIREPKQGCRDVEVKNGLMLVPMTAFTPQLDRLGYGGGYYDRYVGESPFVTYAGVAFSSQMTDFIPVEEHDKRPDIIITEKTEYRKTNV
ncbi:MAG: 5-formyltetrahydrofolate cyclo-ligase [Lachnospiraceae bacterium]|nr:5-formyltetrahydrofolate cyclo-ligase [Lachnospiraceae bacterium]